jgi:hypothetical protein
MASRSNCWRHARNERRMPPAFDGRISTLFAAKQTMQRYLTEGGARLLSTTKRFDLRPHGLKAKRSRHRTSKSDRAHELILFEEHALLLSNYVITHRRHSWPPARRSSTRRGTSLRRTWIKLLTTLSLPATRRQRAGRHALSQRAKKRMRTRRSEWASQVSSPGSNR